MTPETTVAVEAILSDDDIATLNAARNVLEALESSCRDLAWRTPSGYIASDQPNAANYGAVSAKAATAGDAIFDLLNWANSHHVRTLTDEQLHNRQECRDCGGTFPYDADADRCPACVADNTEPPCSDPRPDPRTHPEYWTE